MLIFFYQIVLMKTKQKFKGKRNDLNFMKKKFPEED